MEEDFHYFSCSLKKKCNFAAANRNTVDSVAQQVEHNTFNVGVLGSSPSRVTKTKKPREFGAFLVSIGFIAHG